MTTDLIKRSLLFVAFVLAQVVVLGRIHLFGCATPLLYVWMVILFPRNYPKSGILLWSFMLGLVIDTFFNTPGVAAASLTLIAIMQPYFFELFVPRDSVDNLEPSVANIGLLKYATYVSVIVVVYCMVFFLLEMFSMADPLQWIACVVGSAALTLAFIFTFEIVRSR